MKKAKLNDTVKVHYTGLLSNGEIFDSSEGRDPLEFKLGSGQVIKGFDQGVLGMEIDEEKTIEIPAKEAYGEVNKDLIQNIPKTALPEDIVPEVGLKLVSRTNEGQEIPLIVTEVQEESFTIDANHPLAGKDLTFKVQLVEIV